MIETIARDQAISLLIVARELASRRGQTKITTNDILFQVRHDPEHLVRLQNCLRWKDIRKQAKITRAEGMGNHVAKAAERDVDGNRDDNSSTKELTPSAADRTPSHPVPLPSILPPCCGRRGYGVAEATTIITATTAAAATVMAEAKRTSTTPGRTAVAGASFTYYRKKRALADWCGFARWRSAGTVGSGDRKDDEDYVLEMVGLLACEWVRTLTERALAVRDKEKHERAETRPFFFTRDYGNDDGGDEEEIGVMEARAVQPGHIRRAYEMLQTQFRRYTAIMNRTRSRPSKKRLRMF
ncbi:hypothetical protein VTH82DRAFT_5956 [Thermothelomyces myriococcoides]